MSEIVVRGAGIIGLTVAWELARRGAKVLVVDPNGVASGASGGIVGALAPHVPEQWNEKKAMQFRSLEMAERMWTDVAEISGQDPGYARTGRIQPLTVEGLALAQERAAAAGRHWQGRHHWRVVPVAEAGLRVLSPSGFVVHDTLTARIHPRQACRALAAALSRLDVSIVAEAPQAAQEVWATGVAGLISLSAELGKPVGAGIKGQAALLACDLGQAPQLFVDGLHIVPHGDGTVAIGSTTEREFAAPDTTDGQLDALIAKARAACPDLDDSEVIERWAGLRPRARTRAPMVGPHPTRPGTYIANGGFKIGFGIAPVMAEMLADEILGRSGLIPEAFLPAASL